MLEMPSHVTSFSTLGMVPGPRRFGFRQRYLGSRTRGLVEQTGRPTPTGDAPPRDSTGCPWPCSGLTRFNETETIRSTEYDGTIQQHGKHMANWRGLSGLCDGVSGCAACVCWRFRPSGVLDARSSGDDDLTGRAALSWQVATTTTWTRLCY